MEGSGTNIGRRNSEIDRKTNRKQCNYIVKFLREAQ